MGKQARIRAQRRMETCERGDWFDQQPGWRKAMYYGLAMALCALLDSGLALIPLVLLFWGVYSCLSFFWHLFG